MPVVLEAVGLYDPGVQRWCLGCRPQFGSLSIETGLTFTRQEETTEEGWVSEKGKWNSNQARCILVISGVRVK